MKLESKRYPTPNGYAQDDSFASTFDETGNRTVSRHYTDGQLTGLMKTGNRHQPCTGKMVGMLEMPYTGMGNSTRLGRSFLMYMVKPLWRSSFTTANGLCVQMRYTQGQRSR
jgi:hypothetical protein